MSNLSKAQKKALSDYIQKNPHADVFDIMFQFPELSLKEAHRAIQNGCLPWWFLLAVISVSAVITLSIIIGSIKGI